MHMPNLFCPLPLSLRHAFHLQEQWHSSGMWVSLAAQYLLAWLCGLCEDSRAAEQAAGFSVVTSGHDIWSAWACMQICAQIVHCHGWILDVELGPPRIPCFPVVLVKLSWTKLIPIPLVPAMKEGGHVCAHSLTPPGTLFITHFQCGRWNVVRLSLR